jgi:soluble lytic murein transglycosylase-like protein
LPCLWFAIVLGALTPQPSHAAERSAASATIATSIDEAAARFELPRGWISAVIAVESGGDVRARSPKGAMGLMQLMPGTWRALSVQHQLGSDPYDQRANVLAGSAYLRELFDQFGPEGFLAAYNAGPSRYLEARMDRRPLPPETVAYVAKVERKIAGAPDVWPPVRVKRLSDWRTSNLFVGAPSFSEKGEAGGLFPEPANGVSP